MSNAYLLRNNTTPPPGSVIKLTPDLGGTVTPDGTGNINVFGKINIVNNTNGIQTFKGAASELDIRLTNRANVTSTTSDGAGQTQNVVLMTPDNATANTFRVLVTAYDSANNEAIGGEEIGLFTSAGGTVTIIGISDTFDEASPGLMAADWNIISTSPTLSIEFIGVAGRTINWRAVFEYTQSP